MAVLADVVTERIGPQTLTGSTAEEVPQESEDSPMRAYVGLDVHSKSSVFVIQNERGEELGRGEVPTSAEGFSALRMRFRLQASTPVALESGTIAFFAGRKLREPGLPPVVVDAREVTVKAHRPRQKSDTRASLRQRDSMNGWMSRASATSWTMTPDRALSLTAFSLNSAL